MTDDLRSRNERIVDEFRANEGRVGGRFEGRPMLLLHHVGRRSGRERVNPLVAQPLERGWAVFASAGGRPEDPEWYRNLMAAPETVIEFGTAVHPVRAREAEGEERDRIWDRQVREMPGFGEYEERAGRRIPVVVLEPRGG
jgi:deazaflavin-dependent oxidoreductase (nitroreductase family)